MIKVRDWIASIPEEEKRIAYVGEGMSEQREFFLCGEGWEKYKDYSFHLDMEFDTTTITTRDTRQVVQTTVNNVRHNEEAGVTEDSVTTKETFTVCDEEVLGYDRTDVAALDKWVEADGIRLTWTVLRQQTVLPGKLKATIRAVGEDPKCIKKSAMMTFEVDASVVATPAAMPAISEFEQMENQMDHLRQQTVAAAEEGMRYSVSAASSATGAAQAQWNADKSAQSAAASAESALQAKQTAVEMANTAVECQQQVAVYGQQAEAAATAAIAAYTDAQHCAEEADAAMTDAKMAMQKCSQYAMRADESAINAEYAKTILTDTVESVDTLNTAVFDMEVVEPSINLWNPAAAHEETLTADVVVNTAYVGKRMLMSGFIPCEAGDWFYPRTHDENNIVGVINYNCHYYRLVGANGERSKANPNKTYGYQIPETTTYFDSDITGIEIGVWADKPDGYTGLWYETASDIMVTKNEAPAKGSEFVEYREGGVVKHSKIEKNRAELQEQIDTLTDDVEALKNPAEDGDISTDVKALNAAVFETVDLNPCINLFNPNQAEVETLTNCANAAYNGKRVLVSDTIPCVTGDWFYPRVRGEDGKAVAINYNCHYYRLVDVNGVKSKANPSITYQYKIPGSFTGATGAIDGIEIGVWADKPDGYTGAWYESASEIMVIKNEAPTKDTVFVDWHESEIVTRDRITPLQEQVDTLCASVDEQMGEMRDQVAKVASGAGTIPAYWEGHLAEKIARVRELQRAGGKDCYSFVALSDYHGASNSRQSPALIKRIADACNIKYCLCLGDIQSGGAIGTKEWFVNDWENIHEDFAPIRGMTLFTAGNHDGAYGTFDKDGSGSTSGNVNENYVYNFTRDEIYDFVFRPVSKINGVVFNDTGDAYYVDDTTAKVRYLLMNTHWTVDGVDENGCAIHTIMRHSLIGQSQQDFAIEALKSLPDNEWDIVVGCHEPITATPLSVGIGGGGRDLSLFRDVLVAFQNRTTISRTYGTEGEYTYVSVNADFTDAVGRVAGAFAGHIHKDDADTTYPFPIVVHANDNTGASFAGTIEEQCFDIVTVNKRDGMVYMTRVGKGADRVATRAE